MVGGEQKAFDAVLPIFEIMGKNIVLQGPAGSGQHTKMANQIAIAAGMIAISESLVYARRSGLDPETVLKSIGGGAAASWSLNTLGPRMIAGDFEPGFYVKHFIKDMRIAIESAEAMGLDLPGLKLAKKLYDQLAAEGGEDKGTQAIYLLIEANKLG
jgi:3-hydroxyisobutyrate dehydrogenase